MTGAPRAASLVQALLGLELMVLSLCSAVAFGAHWEGQGSVNQEVAFCLAAVICSKHQGNIQQKLQYSRGHGCSSSILDLLHCSGIKPASWGAKPSGRCVLRLSLKCDNT